MGIKRTILEMEDGWHVATFERGNSFRLKLDEQGKRLSCCYRGAKNDDWDQPRHASRIEVGVSRYNKEYYCLIKRAFFDSEGNICVVIDAFGDLTFGKLPSADGSTLKIVGMTANLLSNSTSHTATRIEGMLVYDDPGGDDITFNFAPSYSPVLVDVYGREVFQCDRCGCERFELQDGKMCTCGHAEEEHGKLQSNSKPLPSLGAQFDAIADRDVPLSTWAILVRHRG